MDGRWNTVLEALAQAKHGETERRMQELETAVKQLQVERDALAIKADTLERCLLQGEPGPDGVRAHHNGAHPSR